MELGKVTLVLFMHFFSHWISGILADDSPQECSFNLIQSPAHLSWLQQRKFQCLSNYSSSLEVSDVLGHMER